jgi:hypothetical protein
MVHYYEAIQKVNPFEAIPETYHISNCSNLGDDPQYQTFKRRYDQI